MSTGEWDEDLVVDFEREPDDPDNWKGQEIYDSIEFPRYEPMPGDEERYRP